MLKALANRLRETWRVVGHPPTKHQAAITRQVFGKWLHAPREGRTTRGPRRPPFRGSSGPTSTPKRPLSRLHAQPDGHDASQRSRTAPASVSGLESRTGRRLPWPARDPCQSGPCGQCDWFGSVFGTLVGVVDQSPAFARDSATAEYYEQRAAEYDEWYLGEGHFAARDRPGWREEVDQLVRLVDGLPAGRTLDVACGSGFLTRHLHGLVVGIDQSPAMVSLTQSRLPKGIAIVGDALNLPFADAAFDRVLTGHFYGHLPDGERAAFLSEARRVAGELVVIDSAMRPRVPAEQWQTRVLNDGSKHRVFKRYVTGSQLSDELNGAEVLFDGSWFVAARATWA